MAGQATYGVDAMSARSLTVYRLDSETVVLAAAFQKFPKAPVSVQVDGRPARGTVIHSVFELITGRFLLLAIGRIGTEGKDVTFLAADGEPLAHHPMIQASNHDAFSVSAVLDVIVPVSDKVRFLRLICQECSTMLGLSESIEYHRMRLDSIQQTLNLAMPCAVERCLTISPGFNLVHFRGDRSVSIEAVQWHAGEKTGFSPFRPIWLSEVSTKSGAMADAVLLVESTDATSAQVERLLLWSKGAAFSVELIGQAVGHRADLVPFVRSRSGDDLELITYLAGCLGPHCISRPDISECLNELTLLVPPRETRMFVSERPVGLGVDVALTTSEDHFFFSGWVFDPHNLIKHLIWLHPSGERVPVSRNWAKVRPSNLPERYRTDERGDEATGFVGSIETAKSVRYVPQHRFEVQFNSGARAEIVAPPAALTPELGRNAVLRAVSDEDLTSETVWRHFAPVVQALHRSHLSGERIRKEVEIGDPPSNPQTTIVIPLYKALEFMRYQFAAFGVDPDIHTSEVIFVLDSPEQSEEVEERLRAFYGVYGVASKLIVHYRNLGYAPAVNTGARRARGNTLVLLNSDVVPVTAGWTRALCAELKGDVGAVGPKLLFHDDSIQHAGMDVGRDLRGRSFNRHPFKGYPRDYPDANAPRYVRALTGACIAINRETFVAVGGICEDYVIGDFEDSDFCFRIAKLGKKLLYVPEAELYHYERQSIAQNENYSQTMAASYNRRLHALRWDEALNLKEAGERANLCGEESVGREGTPCQ